MKILKYFCLCFCVAVLFISRTTTYAQEVSNEISEKKIVTLTFYSDKNTIFEIISGENGLCITNKIPVKENYRFLYWTCERNGEMVEAPYGYVFEEDTDFYAVWEPQMGMPAEVVQSSEDAEKQMEQKQKLKAIRSKIRRNIQCKKPVLDIKNKKKNTLTIAINASKFEKDGYKIQYSTSKKFKKAKTITIKSTKKKLNKKIKKLKKGKTYYIRVRAYRIYDPSQYGSTDSKETFYSKWSKTKKIKITK